MFYGRQRTFGPFMQVFHMQGRRKKREEGEDFFHLSTNYSPKSVIDGDMMAVQ